MFESKVGKRAGALAALGDGREGRGLEEKEKG